MRALRQELDQYPVELLSDFRRFYSLDFDSILEKDPLRAEFLLQGLIQIPESLYRAVQLRKQKSKAPVSQNRTLDWSGWDQSTMLLMMIYNAILSTNGGKKASRHLLKPPSDRSKLSSTDIINLGYIPT